MYNLAVLSWNDENKKDDSKWRMGFCADKNAEHV